MAVNEFNAETGTFNRQLVIKNKIKTFMKSLYLEALEIQ